MDKLYSISKTAEILDVTPKTLRVWEQNLPNKKYLFIAKNIQKQSARNRVTRITLKKNWIIVFLNLRNLNVRRLNKYYYRFGEPCNKQQGVNVEKVA